jgi:hypothetical protein
MLYLLFSICVYNVYQATYFGSCNEPSSSFTHSFQLQMQNVTIPCCSQRFLPFLSFIYLFLPLFSPSILLSFLTHLALYFLVHPLILLIPNSYTILFWELYFLPSLYNVETNIIYVTLLSLLYIF